ncbi:MAG TPA: PEP/pyruvate-binding domain-containing protein [Burkholderiales bacterium]|nr:PEP/pyruvate-binding domain-containing protein [Burkholderiales bacterium]
MQLRVAATPRFEFGTKAENLLRLKPLLRNAKVLDLTHFSVEQWREQKSRILKRIAQRLPQASVIVRSSARCEDGARASMAGAFASVLNVNGRCPWSLAAAIEQVVASMTGSPLDQVLVQPMLRDVLVAGVILTHDLVHGSPYYVLNFDDETGCTDRVTSGQGVHKSLRVHRDAPSSYLNSPRVCRFLALAREIESHCAGVPLDIEFALTAAGELYLLQVRRIAAAYRWHPVTERRVSRQLTFVESFVREFGARRPGMYGSRTILAVMPDWNPAEIIGTTPRPLAASLYRELITREVWREARAAMGYRRLPPDELMVLINSRPYVDVRASFNSFLPAGVDAATAEALVDAWLDRLACRPELHDKVEFEIASTCADFTFERALRQRCGGVLSVKRRLAYREQLHALTSGALRLDAGGTLAHAESMIAQLDTRYAALAAADFGHALSNAVRRVRDCRALGTLGFAIVARHAFIAEALLRSAIERGALRSESLRGLRQSVRSVTSNMLTHYQAVCRGRASREEFLARFGHLRPGTYDITSLRYDCREDLFAEAMPLEPTEAAGEFRLAPSERRALSVLLRESGYARIDASGLLAYARRAIAARESAKFVFSRVLSDALELLARWGMDQGLSRDDLSFLEWHTIDQYAINPAIDYTDRHFLALAEQGRQRYSEAHAFQLSHIIRDPRDIYVALQHRSEPNFVGIRAAVGNVVQLTPHSSTSLDLFDRIVLIENADPGYDWIFTRGIRALVTQFGGANSHMAVRCAELDIPAAIGCGEQSYQRIARAGAAELDCGARVLRAVHVA